MLKAEKKIFRLLNSHNKFHKVRNLLSIIGLLNFCTKCVPVGRAFLAHMYHEYSGKNPNAHVSLSPNARQDLYVWLVFLHHFNGTCMFLSANPFHSPELEFYTDSSLWGCGGIMGKTWFQVKWPTHITSRSPPLSMAFLELVPVVLALYVFQDRLSNKRVLLWSDNMAVVAIINRKTTHTPEIMALLRKLVLQALKINCYLTCRYVPTYKNTMADCISRGLNKTLFKLNPQVSRSPIAIHPSLLPL